MPTASSRPPSVAVIGAGLAGLAAARALATARCAVTVFDKGRGPGGRLSTRRADPWRFDHGGQYLSVRDPGFRAEMDRLLAAGTAARWEARIVRIGAGDTVEDSPAERFVGIPGMNALVRGMAEGLPEPVRHGITVLPPERHGDRWRLNGSMGENLSDFDIVIISAPAPQAVSLLSAAPSLAARAAGARMAACWAAMAVFDAPVRPGWDAAFVTEAASAGAILGWAARDASKPGRPDGESWVLHGSPAWSDANLELGAEEAAGRLLDAFRGLTGTVAAARHLSAHRWRYALPTAPLGVGSLWDGALGIGACGDWCVAARTEAAFVSGRDLARRVIAELESPRPPRNAVSVAS